MKATSTGRQALEDDVENRSKIALVWQPHGCSSRSIPCLGLAKTPTWGTLFQSPAASEEPIET